MNHVTFPIKPLALLGLSSFSPLLLAQSEAVVVSETVLNPVIVTANLTSRTVEQSLASVTVIAADQIQQQQPLSVTELMAGQPGVDISSNGGVGKSTSVFIRGANTESTKLLIDGIPLYSATAGGAAWQYLSPGVVNRLEIVRGPKASLYGADAAGGVVQVFLPTPTEHAQAEIALGAGSFGTRQLEASAAGKVGATGYFIGLSDFETAGQKILASDTENKGYDNRSLVARLNHEYDSGVRLSGLVMRSRGHNDYPGGDNDYQIQVAGLTAAMPINNAWETQLQWRESRDESETLSGSSKGDRFNTKAQGVRWHNIFWTENHEFILGADLNNDTITTTSKYAETSRDNTAIFAQGLFQIEAATVQLNLRQDENEAYGEQTTGGVALGYALDDAYTLRASYATAFRAPTFNDLYYPGSENPSLTPETSATVELGLRAQYQHYFWDLAVYEANYDDLIAWAPAPTLANPYRWTPSNINKTRIRGAELATGATVSDWVLQGAISLTDPVDMADNTRLARRAVKSARLAVDRHIGDWSVGGTVIAQGRRYDKAKEVDELAGYGLLDLRASYDFAKDWQAKLTVKNVLDKDYYTTKHFSGENYLNPGRGVFVTVNYSAF